MTNTHEPSAPGGGETPISISGKKIWNDDGDKAGIRPASITIKLLADGVVKETKVVSAAEDWEWKFEGLPEYDGENKIVYSFEEEPVPEYTVTIEGTTITNTYKPEDEKTQITITKVWVDNNDKAGLRPTAAAFAARIHLFADGVEIAAVPVVKDNGDGTYTVKYTDLPKKDGGAEIVYSVKEDKISGYTSDKTEVLNGGTITNTHKDHPPTRPTKPETPPDKPETPPDEPVTPPDEPVIPSDDTPYEPSEETPHEPTEDTPYVPSESTPEDTPYTPATGDTTNITLWMAMFFISGGVLALLLVMEEKRKKNTKN